MNIVLTENANCSVCRQIIWKGELAVVVSRSVHHGPSTHHETLIECVKALASAVEILENNQ